MTTMFTQEKVCAVCASSLKVNVIGSTNEFGSKDLDLRPAEMRRSTYAFWTEHCTHCGYCASDISTADDSDALVVHSKEYQAQRADENLPKLASIFLCEAMLLKAKQKHSEAGMAFLHAAWACDDKGEQLKAISCRLQSLAQFELVRAAGETIIGNPIADYILIADLQRRTDQFDSAIATCVEGLSKASDANLNNLIRFQQFLSTQQDAQVHKVDDGFKWANENPA